MIQIRKLNNDLINETREFIEGIIKNDFGYELNSAWHKDVFDIEGTYLISRNIFYVATEDNKIVGTIGGRAYDRNYRQFADKYKSTNTLGIWRHYIHKDLRGRGLGTKMLVKLEEEAKSLGYKYLYLHTQKTIKDSLEYWLAKGYTITDDTNDEYQTVHLEKTLN